MAAQLTNLRIEEISGVDSPANELPGWIVRKNKDGSVDEEATKAELEKLEKNYAMLYSSLTAGLEYFDGANDEVKGAVNKVLGFLEKVLTGEDTGSPEEQPAEKSDDEVESFLQKLKKFMAIGQVPEPEPEKVEPEPEEEPATKSEPAPEAEPEPAAKSDDKPEEEPAAKSEPEVEKTEPEPEPAAKSESDSEVADAIKTLSEVTVKVLERIEKIEDRQAGRQSLDGQEEIVKSNGGGSPTLTDAFRSAAQGNRVTIR